MHIGAKESGKIKRLDHLIKALVPFELSVFPSWASVVSGFLGKNFDGHKVLGSGPRIKR